MPLCMHQKRHRHPSCPNATRTPIKTSNMLFGPEEERQYREFLNAGPGMVIDTFKTAPKSVVPGKRQTSDEAPARKPTQPSKPYTNLTRRLSTEDSGQRKSQSHSIAPRGIASKPTEFQA
ncbi:hypothetical protein SNE40_010154 [Patella caerulea]|uniref:Uncharacterized protein n=1 Tax=Patella caerulea TaxID=87958 RepID=A0AAN8JUN8_PATCE